MASGRFTKVQEYVAHGSTVNCMQLGRKSGSVFVTGGDDKKVNVWAVGKANAIMSLAGHTSAVECVSFDSNEQTSREIFRKICDELYSHRAKDENGNPTGDPPKFLDDDFPTEECWYAGGKPDELNEMGNQPANWRRLSDIQSSLNIFGLKPSLLVA